MEHEELVQSVAEDVIEEVQEDPEGLFESISAIWHTIVDEVVPAFQRIWRALVNLWDLIEDFLSRWIGEPILNNINAEKFWAVNDAVTGFVRGLSDGFWGFFLD